MNPVTVETNGRFYLGGRAALVSDLDREVAWAEHVVRQDPDIKWILGNYVQADVANDNGHIFPLADLEQLHHTVVGKPLNMLHHENYIVGAYAGTELVHPSGENAAAGIDTPFVEAVAGMWHRLFPDEYQLVKKAHADGTLFFSMECLPKTVTCPGCSMVAAYAGPTSDTYCDHMNAPRGPKVLNQPVFGAGAIIIPPVRPGWSRADITQLDKLMRDASSPQVYAAMQQIAPELEPAQWEHMMAWVMGLHAV